MKLSIINESGDWKEMLYTKDKATYEIKDQEIIDFFTQLSEAYSNGDDTDELFEYLYNLLNYGYLYSDSDFDDDDYDYDDDYDDDDDDDFDDYDDELEFISQEGFKLIHTEIEYYVDNEKVSKDDYDVAWDDRLGYLGSSNWEENELTIINVDTEEIIFSGKIS